jgi:diaminopimelate decarboxylase
MPMSQSYKDRLFPILPQLAAHYGTPFHIYDEAGIRATGAGLNQAFAGIPGFREYYAVKALPNRHILEVLSELGFGFDCSSIAELILSRQAGARGEDICSPRTIRARMSMPLPRQTAAASSISTTSA